MSKYQLKILQAYFQTISTIHPNYASKKAVKLFQKVRKKEIRPREQEFFDMARHSTVKNGTKTIDIYEIGDANAKPIILLHGWDSNAGSLTKIAKMVLNNGYKVISMNLPGHAFSETDSTNLLDSKNAFKVFINHIDPQEPIHIISHSFGSAIVAFGFSELPYKIDQLIFLTSPNVIMNIFKEFQSITKLGHKAFESMCNWASKLLGEDIRALSMANKLKKASFNNLTLIHDVNDKIISINSTEEIHAAIPGSKILKFKSIGHYRMLWNNDVIETISNIIGRAKKNN